MREEDARLRYVYGDVRKGTRWQQFKAWALCRKGHDPRLVEALWFVPFAIPHVECNRCGQWIEEWHDPV